MTRQILIIFFCDFLFLKTDTGSLVDKNGMNVDINVLDIDNNKTTTSPTADIKHLFKPLPRVTNDSKGRSLCKTCA